MARVAAKLLERRLTAVSTSATYIHCTAISATHMPSIAGRVMDMKPRMMTAMTMKPRLSESA